MNEMKKLEIARSKLLEICDLLIENEYEQYFVSHLIPIKIELERQLTNLQYRLKIQE